MIGRLRAFWAYTGEVVALAPGAGSRAWLRAVACWLLLRSYVPRLPGPAVPVRVRRRGTDVRLWLQTYGDLDVVHELFVRDEYAAVALPAAPAVILDVGANIGLASVDFKLRWPGARIVAVEPDPRSFALLERNVAAWPDVAPVRAAVADADGEAEFFTSDVSVVGGLQRTQEGQRALRVRTLTLATLLRDHAIDRVDLLKLDVEGGEEAALADPAPLERVAAIVGEIHPGVIGRSAEAFCAERLAGYDVQLGDRPRVEGEERLFSARRG